MNTSVFKSTETRDHFRAHYNQILSQFPFEQHYIETTYGKTFLLAAGSVTNAPLVLLHGSCSNSAFWFPEIMALSSSYRVYAIDIIGEAGNSEEYRLDLNALDYAQWIKETLDILGLEKPVVIGNSLGGWMALKFATNYPERVSKLGLIASAGLAEVSQQFIDDVAQSQQENDTVSVDASVLGEVNLPKEILDFMNLIVESYHPIQHLPLYSDEALQHLNMPVLFVDGQEDAIINAGKSAERLKRLVPSAETHLLVNCGHVVPNALEYIIPFLG